MNNTRIRRIGQHMRSPALVATTAPTSAAGASAPPKLLLTDDQMLRFLATGWLSLPLAPPGDPLHARILERAEQLGREGEHSMPLTQQPNRGEPWSAPFEPFNVHPRIAGMQDVLDHPVMTGALTSVLGEDYALNAHRSVAFAGVSTSAHKDTQRFPVAVHRPRTVYVFYLPAGATLEMAPTAIIPQSHWLGRDQGDEPGTNWRSVANDPTALAPSLTEHLCTAPANQGKKTGFLSHLYIKAIFLPRQTRDKHRESTPKIDRFVEGTAVLLHHAIFHRGSVTVRDAERRIAPDNPRCGKRVPFCGAILHEIDHFTKTGSGHKSSIRTR
jgi:hypothetical protein